MGLSLVHSRRIFERITLQRRASKDEYDIYPGDQTRERFKKTTG